MKSNSDKKAAQKQANQQYSNDWDQMWKQREWYFDDLYENRAWDQSRLYDEREYNRKELDEARAYSREALGHLVADSEAAGFNPLTVLRGGGASSYNAGAGFAPLSSPSISASPTPMFSPPVKRAVGGSAVGDAAGVIGDFLQSFDPFADQKKEQEYRLVESQIAALNASALSGASSGSASYASGTTERRPSGSAAALGKPSPWTAGDVTVTNPFQTRDVDPNWSDAATWEQRYGEPGSWVGGAVVGAADTWDYAKKRVVSAWNAPVERNSAMRTAARWVDKTLGTSKSKKSGRVSKPFTGGGGGW